MTSGGLTRKSEHGNGPCGELYWSEMTSDEKIEKLQNELNQTQHALKRLSDYVTKLISHDHKDGKLTSVIEHLNSECESYGGFYFKVYDKK